MEQLIKMAQDIDTEPSQLAKVIRMRMLMKSVEEKLLTLCEDANTEYEAMLEEFGRPKQLMIEELALLTANSNLPKWEFPAHVTQLEQQLKTAKQASKDDGSAIKTEAKPIDRKNAFLFKVSLLPQIVKVS